MRVLAGRCWAVDAGRRSGVGRCRCRSAWVRCKCRQELLLFPVASCLSFSSWRQRGKMRRPGGICKEKPRRAAVRLDREGWGKATCGSFDRDRARTARCDYQFSKDQAKRPGLSGIIGNCACTFSVLVPLSLASAFPSLTPLYPFEFFPPLLPLSRELRWRRCVGVTVPG